MEQKTRRKKRSKGPNILTKYFVKYKFHYLIGIVALIAVNIINLRIPLITGRITDGLQSGLYTYNDIQHEVLTLLLIGFSIACIRFVWRYFIFGTSRKIEYGLRNDFFSHLEKLSTRFFNENKTGDLMALATNDLNAIRMMVGPGILMALDAIGLTVLVIYKMSTAISVKLTLISIIPLPIIAIGSLLLGKSIRARFKDKQEAFSHMSDLVQENISGIKVIKAFVQESKQTLEFNKTNRNNYNKNMRVIKVYAIMMPMAMLVTGLSITIILGYGGYITILGRITLGEFVAFIQYLLMLVWPMIAFGWCINIMSQGMASFARFTNILNEKPDIIDEETVKEIDNIKGDIRINNLTFSYPGSENNELENINISIDKGETIGIVGRTGSGKTTLVNMLLRLYNPSRNEIFIDDTDIMDIPLSVLRNAVGYVPQDNFLFSDTISRNIAFGVDGSTNELVQQAAKDANVHDNIMEFTDKYETVVGERGVTLSGGQKQRVAIARALIKKPAIMILDDSVSAVDTNTEEQILSHIKEERKDKTTIIIAHRISTVQNSDKIIVLDEGKILEVGKHIELLDKKGLYYDMVQKQQLEKELEEE
ncbi:MAG: ABC transporter ATP-binding protein/permease [Vallitalea sp.]|jgi:ATP-binding cassette subfamily B protein|nr:ABC transporter ATP-binding protein/permease [Vallitalea sp.]